MGLALCCALAFRVNDSDEPALGEAEVRKPNLASSFLSTKERDLETGNDYFGARYFSSTMGRFLSPDWSKNPQGVPYANYANPQSLNLYSFVGNNPLTLTDADGHASECDTCGAWLDYFIQQFFESKHSQAEEKTAATTDKQKPPTTEKGTAVERIVLGVEAAANTAVGIPKAAAGSAALVVGTLGSETGIGLAAATAGAYELVQGSGQLLSAGLQAEAAITGNTTGVDEKTDQISASTSIAGVLGTTMNHGNYHAGSKFAAAEGVFSGALAGDIVKGVNHTMDTVLNVKDLATQ